MNQDEFAGDGVDLYDDVIAAPPGGNGGVSNSDRDRSRDRDNSSPSEETNGNSSYHHGNNTSSGGGGRRHQLYVGNLTWVGVSFSFKTEINIFSLLK